MKCFQFQVGPYQPETVLQQSASLVRLLTSHQGSGKSLVISVEKMASKTLFGSGVCLLNRLSNSFLHRSLHSNHQSVSHGLEITPKLFPSVSKVPNSLHLQQNDVDSLKKFAPEGFLYPCGLPSLRFFLPDGTLCHVVRHIEC